MDGYIIEIQKLHGVHLDGYLAAVYAPGWTYTGRFSSLAKAQQWAKHIVARDKRYPMTRPRPDENSTLVEGKAVT